jgi:hypothetical protein
LPPNKRTEYGLFELSIKNGACKTPVNPFLIAGKRKSPYDPERIPFTRHIFRSNLPSMFLHVKIAVYLMVKEGIQAGI